MSVNNYWNTAILIHLGFGLPIAHGCFCTVTTELKSCNRQRPHGPQSQKYVFFIPLQKKLTNSCTQGSRCSLKTHLQAEGFQAQFLWRSLKLLPGGCGLGVQGSRAVTLASTRAVPLFHHWRAAPWKVHRVKSIVRERRFSKSKTTRLNMANCECYYFASQSGSYRIVFCNCSSSR